MKKNLFAFVTIVFILSACGVPATPTLEPTTSPSPITAPTNTPLLTATSGPTGTPTFAVSEMSNLAVDLMDIRITVKNDLVDAIFYLKDLPQELNFDRDGVKINDQEYVWEICVDTDNNKKTGFPSGFSAGADYCLSAMNFKSGDTPITKPIEQEVQVNVWELSASGGKSLSTGTIEVDTEANTIKLSGKITGIKDTSQFYYRTFDANPGGNPEIDSGTLFDRVIIEK